MDMGTLWIVALALGALSLLTLALMGSYRLGRRRRRDEVIIALMDDDAFVRDMGALDRVRDHIRERETRATPSGGAARPARSRPRARRGRPAPAPGTSKRGE